MSVVGYFGTVTIGSFWSTLLLCITFSSIVKVVNLVTCCSVMWSILSDVRTDLAKLVNFYSHKLVHLTTSIRMHYRSSTTNQNLLLM